MKNRVTVLLITLISFSFMGFVGGFVGPFNPHGDGRAYSQIELPQSSALPPIFLALIFLVIIVVMVAALFYNIGYHFGHRDSRPEIKTENNKNPSKNCISQCQ